MDSSSSNPLKVNWREQIKALVASAIAGLTALEGALPDGVTVEEWVGIGVAGLVAYGAVFGLANGRKA